MINFFEGEIFFHFFFFLEEQFSFWFTSFGIEGLNFLNSQLVQIWFLNYANFLTRIWKEKIFLPTFFLQDFYIRKRLAKSSVLWLSIHESRNFGSVFLLGFFEKFDFLRPREIRAVFDGISLCFFCHLLHVLCLVKILQYSKGIVCMIISVPLYSLLHFFNFFLFIS